MTESSPHEFPGLPPSRDEALRRLEQEVGVLIRRLRRVINERARAVHPQLQPPSYLMRAQLAGHGPMRASALSEAFGVAKGPISRQVQHLVDLGLADRVPDPADGRASLVSASDDAVRRLADISAHRRKWVDERLGDWDDAELAAFVDVLGRYNEALTLPEDRR